MDKKALMWALGVAVLATGAYLLISTYGPARQEAPGNTQAPQAGLQQYSSEDGISFMYPDTYELSSRTEGNAERQWDVLVLLPRGYVPPQGGEGPPAVLVGIFPNPEELSLDRWVRGDARSNLKLSADQKLSPMTVGGKEALAYRHSGLYETDAVAVAANGRVYIFAAGWIDEDDQIRRDLQNIIKSVKFN